MELFPGVNPGPGGEDEIRLFLDGVLEASISVDTAAGFFEDGNIGPRWGDNESDGGELDGRIDNIRITIGEPVYTAAFTPPTSRHPTS